MKMKVPVDVVGNRIFLPNYYEIPYEYRFRDYRLDYELVVPSTMKVINEKKYEIIFADAHFETEENKYNEMIDLVLNNELLKPNGIFILEHQSRIKFTHPNLKDTRKYGNVSFSFFQSEPISK